MTLTLHICQCFVCGHDLDAACDQANLDDLEENGNRVASGWVWQALPPARYRRKVAPDLCDLCWKQYRTDFMSAWARGRSMCMPPFRMIYVWAWVADRLAVEGKALAKHMREKIAAARGTKLRGSYRPNGGPRRIEYQRARGIVPEATYIGGRFPGDPA